MRLPLASIFKVCMNILIVLIIELGGSIRSDRLIHVRVVAHFDIRNLDFHVPPEK